MCFFASGKFKNVHFFFSKMKLMGSDCGNWYPAPYEKWAWNRRTVDSNPIPSNNNKKKNYIFISTYFFFYWIKFIDSVEMLPHQFSRHDSETELACTRKKVEVKRADETEADVRERVKMAPAGNQHKRRERREREREGRVWWWKKWNGRVILSPFFFLLPSSSFYFAFRLHTSPIDWHEQGKRERKRAKHKGVDIRTHAQLQQRDNALFIFFYFLPLFFEFFFTFYCRCSRARTGRDQTDSLETITSQLMFYLYTSAVRKQKKKRSAAAAAV